MMKRFAGLPVLCCVGLVLTLGAAAPARAQISCTEPDLLALVFDNGDINFAPIVGTPFTMHVMLLNPSQPMADAFEFRLYVPAGGETFVLGETLPPGTINVGSNDVDYREYIAGWPMPLPPVDGRIELMSFNLLSVGSTPNQEFRVQPTTWPSIAGSLAYNTTTQDGAILTRMTPISGSFGLPLARLYPTALLSYCNGGPTPTALRIDIATAAGNVSDPIARAGTAATATDGFDLAFERPEPALPPSNYVCTSFEHTDWPLGPRFDHDIRAAFDPEMTWRRWPLLVETDRDAPVVLNFTPSFEADAGFQLVLRDLQTQVYAPVFPNLSYSYRNHGLPTARRFELQFGFQTLPTQLPVSRSLPSGWSLVSLPLVPPSTSNTVGQMLLNLSPGFAFAYTYSQASGYHPVATTDIATPGTGYWLGTTRPFNWAAPGAKPINGQTIATSPGWNLVGFPCWFPGLTSGIVVQHNGESMKWNAAAQAGLVSLDVQGYAETAGYFDVTTLSPWQAYWVNVLAPDVTLLMHWRNFQTSGKEALPGDVPVPTSWRTDVTLIDAAGSESVVTLGVDPGATAGFDALYDRPQPPSPPVPGPVFCLLHPEWQLTAGNRFTRDVVGPADLPLSWPLTLTTPAAGNATLRWDPTGWPRDLDLQLYLPAENRVVVASMRAQTSYIVAAGGQPVTLIVRAPDGTSGVGDLPSSVDGHLSVSPNPFNPRATLSFSLAKAATAEVRIYSLRGELVRVVGGTSLGAGPQRFEWDGSDSHGRSMPSGSYFGRLHVDGAVSGETVRMSLVR